MRSVPGTKMRSEVLEEQIAISVRGWAYEN
jgi:hypothetical protein